MKNKMILALCIIASGIAACKNKEQEIQSTSNNAMKVELLFEHDGVKVYRFYDGRTIYYTDARGKTSWSETKSNGKNSRIEYHEVNTEQ